MSNNDNSEPVRVTGQERRHPALRILARACISIAREQMERGQLQTEEAQEHTGEAPPETPKEVSHE